MIALRANPAVNEQRIDKSGFIASTSVLAHAICCYSLRGPLKPVRISTTDQLDSVMGLPNPKVSYAHYHARHLINKGYSVFMRRVTNGARYGGSVVLSNAAANTITSDSYPVNGSLFSADPDPTTAIAPTGPSYIALTFNAPLVTGNTVNMNIVLDSAIVAVSPVTFASNNDATLAALATAIEAAMAGAGSDGKATVIDNDPSSVTNARTIGIFAPSGQNIAITNIAVTSGASQATVTQSTPLFYVQAENPGMHSQGIGYKLTNADVGTKEVITMTASAAFGAVASLTVTINGVDCAQVSNVIPSDAFLDAVAVAIAAHPDVDTAVVNKRPLGNDNDRVITIRMLRGSSTDTVITHAGTGAYPSIYYAQQIKGVSPSGAFDFEVYRSENPTIAAERHRVSIAAQTDDFGQQQQVSYVINQGGTASELIRVISNAPDDGSVVIPFDPITGDITPGIIWLSAGYDGALPTASQIAEAWKDFEDTERYPVITLVQAGYTAVSVGQAMVNVAKTRNDGCEAIIDIPSAYQKSQAMVNYRLQQLAIDSEYGAAYYPDTQMTDPYSGMKLWVPPSGHVAAAYANNDKTRGIGKAPAGMRVGQVDTTAIRYHYKPDEYDQHFTLKLNSIQQIAGAFYIMGDTTLQNRDSALSFVSVARLVGYLQSRIRNRAQYYLFEGNTDTNVFALVTDIDQFLAPFKPSDLNDYKIVSAASNNPTGIIEQGNRIVDVILDPVRSIRRLLVRTTITSTGGIASIDVTEL